MPEFTSARQMNQSTSCHGV